MKASVQADDDELVRRAGVALPPSTRVTPMLRQWLEAKAKAKDAVLLFRMGDFYELFGPDAHTAAEVLELAVTTRDRDKGENSMPMAGFPHGAAPGYIARLIAAGRKVALCDQLEDPALARGIVKRDVTRIVTPGMVLDDDSLEARANNFLVGIAHDEAHGGYGLAALDVSTGELLATTIVSEPGVLDEVTRLQPREIIAVDGLSASLVALLQTQSAGQNPPRVEQRRLPQRRRLVEKLGPSDPLLQDGDKRVALSACELCLLYAEETGQGRLPAHVLPPRGYDLDARLLLDHTTRSHLDLVGPPGETRKPGTLLHLVDRTLTAAGGRRLLRWLLQPSALPERIEERLSRVEALLHDGDLREGLATSLKGMADLERVVARASNGRAGPRDLVRLCDATERALQVAGRLAKAPSWQGALPSNEGCVRPAAELVARLQCALREDAPGLLGDELTFIAGFDPALDELVLLSMGGRDRIAALEESERAKTGIPTLKVRYNSVFGYYLEVTKTHQHKVPSHYRRKQTVATGERYVTDELQRLEEEVAGAEDKRRRRENELFDALLTSVREGARSLLELGAFVADVDALLSFANLAVAGRYTRPRLLPREDRRLHIVDGRHPMVEQQVTERGQPFVPNSVDLVGGTNQILLITGPNMGGKSTLMRQVALIQVLAQAGSFVPAALAELSICDRIFTRVGASDDLSSGRSTFMVEMTETSHILRAATEHSLILLDEIGRGTSTYDGVSIAWAVAEHLHNVTAARTLFATHYHELTRLAESLPRLRNMHVVVKEFGDEVIFVRALADGPAERSYGIQVARLAGLPRTVVERAREILLGLEGARGVVHVVKKDLPHSPPPPPVPQMNLFAATAPALDPAAASSARIVEELRGLDVLRMTPLQAMNALAALVDEAKKG